MNLFNRKRSLEQLIGQLTTEEGKANGVLKALRGGHKLSKPFIQKAIDYCCTVRRYDGALLIATKAHLLETAKTVIQTAFKDKNYPEMIDYDVEKTYVNLFGVEGAISLLEQKNEPWLLVTAANFAANNNLPQEVKRIYTILSNHPDANVFQKITAAWKAGLDHRVKELCKSLSSLERSRMDNYYKRECYDNLCTWSADSQEKTDFVVNLFEREGELKYAIECASRDGLSEKVKGLYRKYGLALKEKDEFIRAADALYYSGDHTEAKVLYLRGLKQHIFPTKQEYCFSPASEHDSCQNRVCRVVNHTVPNMGGDKEAKNIIDFLIESKEETVTLTVIDILSKMGFEQKSAEVAESSGQYETAIRLYLSSGNNKIEALRVAEKIGQVTELMGGKYGEISDCHYRELLPKLIELGYSEMGIDFLDKQDNPPEKIVDSLATAGQVDAAKKFYKKLCFNREKIGAFEEAERVARKSGMIEQADLYASLSAAFSKDKGQRINF